MVTGQQYLQVIVEFFNSTHTILVAHIIPVLFK